MNVTVVGRSNATLSMVIESLLSVYGDEILDVERISNLSVDDDTPFLPQRAAKLRLREVSSEEWSGSADRVILGVLQPDAKRAVFKHFRKMHGISEEAYDTLVHPSAVIARTAGLGCGVQIGPGSIFAPFTEIEPMVTVNRKVSVGHHVRIGRFSTLNPGCNIGGKTNIGERCVVGMGANIFDRVNVGNDCVIGAGALVTKSLPDSAEVLGVAARILD